MKFIVSSAALLKKLQVLSGVINATNTIPVLDHFLFDIDNSNHELFIDASELEEHWNGGPETMQVRWTDQADGASAALTGTINFDITIDPVNDTPIVVTPIDDVIVDEDSDDVVVDLVPVFSDVENGQDLIYLVTENIECLSALIEDGSLSLSFAANAYGSGEVMVTASDVLSSRLSVSTTFTVTINPVNDAPEITLIEDQTIDEDTSLTLQLSASDIDGDQLSFTAEDGNTDLVINGNQLTIIPEDDFNGLVSIRGDSTTRIFNNNRVG